MCPANVRNPLPTITVEEPTVSMSFLINTSPFAGREGKYVTTRNIKDRLARELERNLALKARPLPPPPLSRDIAHVHLALKARSPLPPPIAFWTNAALCRFATCAVAQCGHKGRDHAAYAGGARVRKPRAAPA